MRSLTTLLVSAATLALSNLSSSLAQDLPPQVILQPHPILVESGGRAYTADSIGRKQIAQVPKPITALSAGVMLPLVTSGPVKVAAKAPATIPPSKVLVANAPVATPAPIKVAFRAPLATPVISLIAGPQASAQPVVDSLEQPIAQDPGPDLRSTATATASSPQVLAIGSSLPLSSLLARPLALSKTPILTSSFSASPALSAPLQISQSIDQSQPDLRGPQPATPQTDTNASPSTNTSPNTTAPAVTAPHVPRTATTAVGQYLKALLERDFGMPGYTAPPSDPLPRRAPPPALDPVFPSSEFLGTNAQAPMGVNDNNYAQYPLEQMLWASFQCCGKTASESTAG